MRALWWLYDGTHNVTHILLYTDQKWIFDTFWSTQALFSKESSQCRVHTTSSTRKRCIFSKDSLPIAEIQHFWGLCKNPKFGQKCSNNAQSGGFDLKTFGSNLARIYRPNGSKMQRPFRFDQDLPNGNPKTLRRRAKIHILQIGLGSMRNKAR